MSEFCLFCRQHVDNPCKQYQKDQVEFCQSYLEQQIEDPPVEFTAKALYEHWSNYKAGGAKSWQQVIENLPGLAANFRKEARVAYDAFLEYHQDDFDGG